MPTETVIVVAAIVFFFAAFAGVLAWGDFYTSRSHHPGPAE